MVAHVEGERFTNVRFDVVHQVRVKRCEVEGDVVQRFLDEAVFAVEDLEVREILVSLLKDLMVFLVEEWENTNFNKCNNEISGFRIIIQSAIKKTTQNDTLRSLARSVEHVDLHYR